MRAATTSPHSPPPEPVAQLLFLVTVFPRSSLATSGSVPASSSSASEIEPPSVSAALGLVPWV